MLEGELRTENGSGQSLLVNSAHTLCRTLRSPQGNVSATKQVLPSCRQPEGIDPPERARKDGTGNRLGAIFLLGQL